jgi:hypothetical protein
MKTSILAFFLPFLKKEYETFLEIYSFWLFPKKYFVFETISSENIQKLLELSKERELVFI